MDRRSARGERGSDDDRPVSSWKRRELGWDGFIVAGAHELCDDRYMAAAQPMQRVLRGGILHVHRRYSLVLPWISTSPLCVLV